MEQLVNMLLIELYTLSPWKMCPTSEACKLPLLQVVHGGIFLVVSYRKILTWCITQDTNPLHLKISCIKAVIDMGPTTRLVRDGPVEKSPRLAVVKQMQLLCSLRRAWSIATWCIIFIPNSIFFTFNDWLCLPPYVFTCHYIVKK